MEDTIEIYNLKNEPIKTIDKKEAHKELIAEYRKNGDVKRKDKHSIVILLTPSGKIIIQKTSRQKIDNKELWDKTVGSHPLANETYDFCVVRGCAKELQIPAVVVSRNKFKKSLKSMNLKLMSVLTMIEENEDEISTRLLEDGSFWEERISSAYYIGYYDGSIRFRTDNSSGFRISTLEELESDIDENPEIFTNDLKNTLKRFRHLIKPLSDTQ